MKAGLATSVALHAVLLGLGLFSLSAPSALEVADVESLPVDIIPIEEVTNIQQGEKTATVREKPAPVPTKRPDILPGAQKVGENTVDTDKPPTPEAKPKPVETASAPPPAPKPEPRPVEKPKEVAVEKPAPKPEPVPTPEVAAVPKPQQEVKPDPVAEQIVAEKATEAPAEEVQLPTSAPAPEARPPTPKAQTAQTPERKVAEKPATEASSQPASDEKDFNADEVAALLDKQKPSGGGAKRSTEQASLGGDKTTGGSKLSQSEMDALRGQVQKCWNVPAGALDGSNLRVSVKFKLDRTGTLEGAPEIISGGGASGVERAAAEAAKRAVSRCSPYNLPADKYDAWADVIVNFDPSEMF